MNGLHTAELGFRRALVPLDGSMVAETVLPPFLQIAHALGMEVALVRVVVPVLEPVAIQETAIAPSDTAPAVERMFEDAEGYLRASR